MSDETLNGVNVGRENHSDMRAGGWQRYMSSRHADEMEEMIDDFRQLYPGLEPLHVTFDGAGDYTLWYCERSEAA